MQSAELKGELEIRLARSIDLMDLSKGNEAQSIEYYRAQNALTTFLIDNTEAIMDKLTKLALLERISTTMLGYPDKRVIPASEWESLREAVGTE